MPPNLPETDAVYSRITAIEQRMEARFDVGNERMGRIEQMLADNTVSTEEVRGEITAGTLEIKRVRVVLWG